MNDKYIGKIYDGILFVVVFLLYMPSLCNGFVGDDIIYFINNEHIRSFNLKTILRSGAIGADFLPLRDISFALDYRLWQDNPFGFHLTNVILFGSVVIAARHLFLTINHYLTGNDHEAVKTLSFIAALITAIHPNNREVVYAVYNRGALLTVLFSIIVCINYVKFVKSKDNNHYSYVMALTCYVLALMSREYSLSLPLVLVMIVAWDKNSIRMSRYLYLTPFFLVAFVFFRIFKHFALAGNFIATTSASPTEITPKLALAAKIMLFYLVRMITSWGSFDFNYAPKLTLFSVAVVAGLVIIAVRTKNNHPQILFGLIFYLTCLLPVLNFYGTFPIVSPRYSFLPCIGLFSAIMAVKFERPGRIISMAGVAATLAWTVTTMHKTYYWRDNISFWELMASRDRASYAYLQLGYAYHTAKQFGNARKALMMVHPVPQDAKFLTALGESCLEVGDYDCVMKALENLNGHNHNNEELLQLARKYQNTGDPVLKQKIIDVFKM